MLLGFLLVLVWFICVAFLWNEGMWSNCLTLINTLLSALVAMNYWEPLADWAEGMSDSMATYTYVIDYLCMWLLFFVSIAVMRAATAGLSRTQVRFMPPVEQAGRVVSVLLIGWVIVCFTVTTLHTAPLARTAIRGSFQESPMSNNFFGLAPDRMWLGYVQYRSKGPLATSPPRVFDEQGEFVFKYGERRRKFSEQSAVRVNTN